MNGRLKAILIAGAFGSLASTALGASLIVDTGMGDTHSWESAYIGIFGGLGTGFADQTGPIPPSGPYPTGGVDIALRGGVVGVTAGKNFGLGNGIVLGIAGDAAWSSMGGVYNSTVYPGSLYDGTTHRINFTGAVRGVLGFDGGMFMPYLTAGVAFANATRVSGYSGLVANTTQIGMTAGVGLAFALTANTTIDLQYRMSNYGTGTYNWQANPGVDNPEIGLTTQVVTAGINWNF
jgi:outer membrane immunogenic protein